MNALFWVRLLYWIVLVGVFVATIWIYIKEEGGKDV